MKVFRTGNVLTIAVLALLTVLFLPIDTFGQGRGRRVSGGLSKKCGKFVNCHDARDGRWDGRGPQRRIGLSDRWRIRNRRHRRFDNDDRRLRRRDRVDRVVIRDRRVRNRRF